MTGIEKAVQIAGGQQKLATMLGVKQQHVYSWLKKRVPAERCRPIHEATGVPLAELRPDLFGD